MRPALIIAIYLVTLVLAARWSFSIGKRSVPARPNMQAAPVWATEPRSDAELAIPGPDLQAAASPTLDLRDEDGGTLGQIRRAAAEYGVFENKPAPAVIDQLKLDEIPAALELMVGMDEPARPAFLLALMARWAHFEPALAAEYALEHGPRGQLREALDAIGGTWGTSDPEAAIDWYASHPTQIGSFLKHVFYQWAKRDLAAAMEKATALGLGTGMSQFSGIGALAGREEFRTPILQSLLEVQDEEAQRQALVPAMGAWTNQDLPAAAAWLDEHSITDKYIVKAVSDPFTKRDPLGSAEWQVSRATTPEERAEAIASLSKDRFGRERKPDEVTAWLETLDD